LARRHFRFAPVSAISSPAGEEINAAPGRAAPRKNAHAPRSSILLLKRPGMRFFGTLCTIVVRISGSLQAAANTAHAL